VDDRQRGEREGPVQGLRATVVATTVLGLVLGATTGGVAQDEPVADATPSASVLASPTIQDEGAASSVLLRGTWDYEMTDEEVEFLAELFGPEAIVVGIPGRSTSIRLGFDGDIWWQGYVFDGELWLLDGVPEGDGGRITYEGDELTLAGPVDLGKGAGYATYGWSVAGEELTLTLLECAQRSGAGECPDTDIVRFVMEHTYTSSGNDPSY
jgi:hypothetical protein